MFIFMYCCYDRAEQLEKSGSLGREECGEGRGYFEVPGW
jgi:hypothetical protein